MVAKSSAEWQLKIRQQYDSFCKTLLKHEMIDYERERRYREMHEIPLAGFSEEEVEKLLISDGVMEVTDTEIASYMDIVRVTVRYHKLSSLQMLKKFMEDMEGGEKGY